MAELRFPLFNDEPCSERAPGRAPLKIPRAIGSSQNGLPMMWIASALRTERGRASGTKPGISSPLFPDNADCGHGGTSTAVSHLLKSGAAKLAELMAPSEILKWGQVTVQQGAASVSVRPVTVGIQPLIRPPEAKTAARGTTCRHPALQPRCLQPCEWCNRHRAAVVRFLGNRPEAQPDC
mgnify:CR=1 FL=1